MNSDTSLTNRFRPEPKLTPAEAEQEHLYKTLERHPIVTPISEDVEERHRENRLKSLDSGLRYDQRMLALRLQEAQELGARRAARDIEDAIAAVELARGGLK